VYIYHIPIINLMMFNGCLKNAKDVPIAVGLTLVAATLSWLVVERPAIRRKKRPLQSIAAS
jgi:peptidoglycan/LPS O-acetylase OafA/YrhL